MDSCHIGKLFQKNIMGRMSTTSVGKAYFSTWYEENDIAPPWQEKPHLSTTYGTKIKLYHALTTNTHFYSMYRFCPTCKLRHLCMYDLHLWHSPLILLCCEVFICFTLWFEVVIRFMSWYAIFNRFHIMVWYFLSLYRVLYHCPIVVWSPICIHRVEWSIKLVPIVMCFLNLSLLWCRGTSEYMMLDPSVSFYGHHHDHCM